MVNTDKLIRVGHTIWHELLTDDDREQYYNDSGTIGFMENVANLLHMDLEEVTLTEFEAIHDKLFPEYNDIALTKKYSKAMRLTS